MESIAVEVPTMPPEAIEFAKAMHQLAEKHGLDRIEAKIQIDTGYGSAYAERIRAGERIHEEVTVFVSTRDGRGRPRKRIHIQASTSVTVPVIWEPDSTN